MEENHGNHGGESWESWESWGIMGTQWGHSGDTVEWGIMGTQHFVESWGHSTLLTDRFIFVHFRPLSD